MTITRDTAEAGLHGDRTTPVPDLHSKARCNGYPAKAPFGPNTPRVAELLNNLRDLAPAQIKVVASTWNEASPLDRAQAWAHLTTAAGQKKLVMLAASAARRAAMETAREAGHDDWAFWAAAWDAAAAVTADHLAESDYQTLTYPLGTVIPALKGNASTTARRSREQNAADIPPSGR